MLNSNASLSNLVEKKQNELFQKMSAEEKIKLASDFFKLARALQNSKPVNGTRTINKKNRRNSR